MAEERPIFVECQCETCGSFWRYEEGQEPDEIASCPDCDPRQTVDGVHFVGGERGQTMSYLRCAGCGHKWAVFGEELEAHRGQMIAHCSRCDGDQKHGQIQWAPKGSVEMASKKTSMPAPNGADRIEKERYEEMLLVEIPDSEIRQKADILAQVIEDRDQLKQRRRAVIAQFKDRMNHLDERIKELGESVRTKSERRAVPCVLYLIDRQNKMVLIRTDTNEVVSERAATPEDRQEAMFGDGEGRKKRGRKPKNDTAKPPTDPLPGVL